jgi:hypothetical protein
MNLENGAVGFSSSPRQPWESWAIGYFSFICFCLQLSGNSLKLKDTILKHLTFANSLAFYLRRNSSDNDKSFG